MKPWDIGPLYLGLTWWQWSFGAFFVIVGFFRIYLIFKKE